jgi:hypothetical protein
MTKIQYSRLEGENDIRVLRLFPNLNRRARLQGELLHVDLNQRPKYAALSYVWGTGSDPEPFIYNGQEISIGKNLGQALRHIRPDAGDSLSIWVDALCINQRNTKEKNKQVAIMKEIYWFAEEVMVWLGPDETGRAEDTFDTIRDAIDCVIDSVESQCELQESLHLGLAWSPTTIQQLMPLFECEYFFRTWILQEVGLAKRSTAYWGRATTNFYHITLAAMIVLRYPWSSLKPRDLIRSVQRVVDVYRVYNPSSGLPQQLHYILQIARQNLAGDARDKVYALLSHPAAKDGIASGSGTTGKHPIQDEEVEPRTSEETKLRNLAIVLSPDASEMQFASVRYIDHEELRPLPPNHDIITAYRILTDHNNKATSQRRLWQGNAFIKPDYNKSIVCVYREVVMASIERTESLEILSFVQHPEELAPNGPDFPCWIPRWDNYTGVSVLGHVGCDHFAAANRRAAIKPSPDSGALIVKGIFCDRVALHTIALTYTDFTDHSKPSPIFSMSKHCRMHSKPVPPYPYLPAAPGSFNPVDTDRMKAYRKAWTAGRAAATTYDVSQDEFDPEADFAVYQIMQLQKDYDQDACSAADEDPGSYLERQMGRLIRIEELKAQGGNHGDAGRFAKTVAAVCHGRKFFITENGFFGVGPAATEIGDAVHILLGADVPFLLRQKNMCGRYEPDGSWSLVGECYVQGLMVGEAVRAVGKPSEELDDVILR